jgi:hypothetical protein
VLFSPDAAELGKYQGYLDPAEFADILRRVVAAGTPQAIGRSTAKAPVGEHTPG